MFLSHRELRLEGFDGVTNVACNAFEYPLSGVQQSYSELKCKPLFSFWDPLSSHGSSRMPTIALAPFPHHPDLSQCGRVCDIESALLLAELRIVS